MKAPKFLVLLYLAFSATAHAQPTANDVFVRVVDTGPGLCCAVKMPGPHYMIYDAGYYMGDGEKACIDGIHELIPLHSEIELLVLSHSDSDHLGAVPEICDDYIVKRVLRSGYERDRDTWKDADNKIKAEKDNEGCLDINLRYLEFPPGATYRFGDTFGCPGVYESRQRRYPQRVCGCP